MSIGTIYVAISLRFTRNKVYLPFTRRAAFNTIKPLPLLRETDEEPMAIWRGYTGRVENQVFSSHPPEGYSMRRPPIESRLRVQVRNILFCRLLGCCHSLFRCLCAS